MNVDLWYAIRSGATAYRTAGVTGRLTGAVRAARAAGATWSAAARAAGLSVSTLRRVAA